MPTYLYECEKCGRFEKMQKISEDKLEKCPKCNNEVKKIIGNPGIVFKGSGFYTTDYGKKADTDNSGEEKAS